MIVTLSPGFSHQFSNGTHYGGSEYTTGVTTNGTPGTAGAYTRITVAASAPTLYYYCTAHSGMGAEITTPGSSGGVSNLDGAIASVVNVTTTAGFSIVAWTGIGAGTQAAGSVGHGLSQKPEMVITKSRDDAYNWSVDSILRTKRCWRCRTVISGTRRREKQMTLMYLVYNSLDATKIYPKGDEWAGIGQNNVDYITYCFHSVDGYSKVGSYTGNASSTDGTLCLHRLSVPHLGYG